MEETEKKIGTLKVVVNNSSKNEEEIEKENEKKQGEYKIFIIPSYTLRIIGIPEERLVEEIISENFPNLNRDMRTLI